MEFIVIIPALNPEPCLEKLVDRLWELENQVLVVDDGSEKEYRESFQRLDKAEAGCLRRSGPGDPADGSACTLYYPL